MIAEKKIVFDLARIKGADSAVLRNYYFSFVYEASVRVPRK